MTKRTSSSRRSKEKKKTSPRHHREKSQESSQQSQQQPQQQLQQQVIVVDREYMKSLVCMTKSMYHIKSASVFGFMSLLLYLVMDNGNKKTVYPIINLFLLTAGLNIIFAIAHPSSMTELSLTLLLVVTWFFSLCYYKK